MHYNSEITFSVNGGKKELDALNYNEFSSPSNSASWPVTARKNSGSI